MAQFSKSSKDKLATCHPDLQRLFYEVIKHYDCTVTEGFRNKEDQNKAFANGTSKVKWPNGNHNKNPSLAVDVYPYPVDFNDWKRAYHFAGYVLATADQMGIKIRCGIDWDKDKNFKNNKFIDSPHFELVE